VVLPRLYRWSGADGYAMLDNVLSVFLYTGMHDPNLIIHRYTELPLSPCARFCACAQQKALLHACTRYSAPRNRGGVRG
jgi:hypothetical protein